ncbi:MAG: hypothetical protein HKN49_06070 [Gammaproteobacteria bacterium]|nr:hypothetical protein [Gammaproteobacteria bacterium]
MTLLVIAKVTAIFLVASLALLAMPRASAAVRHTVAVTALLAGLLTPVLGQLVPAWEVLPQPQAVYGNDMTVAAPRGTVQVQPAAVPETAVESVRQTPIDLTRWLAIIWLSGTTGLLLLLVMRGLAMQQDARRATDLADTDWQALLSQLEQKFEFERSVKLKVRDTNSMPAAWGLSHPVILLPADCHGWSQQRRRDVLAHEFGHVMRRDVLFYLIAHISCALHWFNPLAWWLQRRLAIESEHACDDIAIDHGGSATGYANHLLTTAVAYQQQHSLAPVMAARSQLEGRIMAILDTQRNRSRASASAQLMIALAVAVMLVPLSSLAWAQADQWVSGEQPEQRGWQSDSRDFARHLEKIGVAVDDIDALINGLTDRDAMTRGASAWALGKSDAPRVVDPLIQAGYDSDARVRQWAVRSLGSWNEPRIAPMLVDRLQDSDAEVRQWAVRTLDSHSDAVRVQPLLVSLDDGNAEVREWVVRVLNEANDERVQPALANRLAVESNAAVTEWIVRSLDANSVGQSVDALLAALQNDSADVRQWAVRSLSDVESDQVTDAMIGMLGDRDAEVRQWSVRALGACGNGRAIAPLQALREDPDAEVREWVDRSLNNIAC